MRRSRPSLVINAAACTLLLATAAPRSLQAAPQQPSGLSAPQREDIQVFRRDFLSVDKAYSGAARREAERRLTALERSPAAVSSTDFAVEICRIVALADNGHSICRPRGGAAVGLSFTPFADGLFVTKAGPAQAELLGARLLAVDGVSVRRVQSLLRSLAGGTSEHRDLTVAPLASQPSILHALKITRQSDAATYWLQTTQGRVLERRLPVSQGPAEWSTFRPDRAAWAAEEPHRSFRLRDAPELDAVVVQLRTNLDVGGKTIAAFLEEAERLRAERGRRNVILDMRWNPGGNFLKTRDFLLAWPDRLPASGRFFVLTGPGTFSAGIASIAYLEQAAPDRVVIIGEPVGDRLVFFAENNRVTQLPNSKVALLPALQRNDYRTGCRKYDDCLVVIAQPGGPHATSAEQLPELAPFGRKPIALATLDPDVRAPWTFAAYAAGRDPAIEAVSKLVLRDKQSAAIATEAHQRSIP